jgi:uncharacterized tellurite resistance protein B-like protein
MVHQHGSFPKGDKKLDVLRVLIAAAWADGEISWQEMNSLKSYFRELDLDDEQLGALEPYLVDPIEQREAETIITDFLERARGGERATVMAAVRDLVLADGDLHSGEKSFLDLLERSAEETPTAGVFASALERLWGGKGKRTEETRRSDLIDEFVRNRVLYQVKRRLLVAGGGVELDQETERELRYVCALGALLGHVAGVDQRFDADERAVIAEILDEVSALQPRDVDIIVEIVESEVLSDVGYFSFARELNETAGADDKKKVLQLLFEVAAADCEITHEELEEIRKISKALHIDHSTFIAAKQAARVADADG